MGSWLEILGGTDRLNAAGSALAAKADAFGPVAQACKEEILAAEGPQPWGRDDDCARQFLAGYKQAVEGGGTLNTVVLDMLGKLGPEGQGMGEAVAMTATDVDASDSTAARNISSV